MRAGIKIHSESRWMVQDIELDLEDFGEEISFGARSEVVGSYLAKARLGGLGDKWFWCIQVVGSYLLSKARLGGFGREISFGAIRSSWLLSISK
ncbi:hypothetical protein CEXT_371701 [Caerostris extrusa]|uniref:Uncharacterized protein n=1 Tax=Caerostris extrusa TaxID=172846 RepID=A0AAV4PRY7_CAEEX|nr:hypothetical protein CEXT_371701 [Caerostris extrusa]